MAHIPPQQARATRQGRIDLRPLGAAHWSARDVVARLQITEAFHRFGVAHDEACIDVLVSCFTADAVYEVANASARSFVSYRGRAEIGARLEALVAEQADQRRHLISNVLVERLDGSTATAIAYGVVTAATDELRLGASVIYHAELVCEDDGVWRFSSFFIGLDQYAGSQPRSTVRA